jgi:hypothetical protein
MSSPLLDAVDAVSAAYYHLVVLVGPHGSGKTRLLQAVAAETGWPVVNLGLELAKSLVDIPPAHRSAAAAEVTARLLTQRSDVVIVDNIEALFEPSLKLQPLELLKQASRSATLVVAWPGASESGALVYATPGYREHRSRDATGVSVLPIQSTVSH